MNSQPPILPAIGPAHGSPTNLKDILRDLNHDASRHRYGSPCVAIIGSREEFADVGTDRCLCLIYSVSCRPFIAAQSGTLEMAYNMGHIGLFGAADRIIQPP